MFVPALLRYYVLVSVNLEEFASHLKLIPAVNKMILAVFA